MTKLRPLEIVVEPVLETEKSVVVAEAVDEPMEKSVVLVSPSFAWTANLASGLVVPIPIFWFPVITIACLYGLPV